MQPNPPAPTTAAPRSTLWRPGALIGGRYRLRAPIGAGAMGEVWSAEHLTLGTTVAVKLVDTANRDDAAETLARFEQEARAAAQLKSPHVVQILDHGAYGRVAFIAMELLEGESLEGRIARRGRLLPSEVAHVIREMARGIDRAHAAGIVHRDIKPPNVFLARIDGVEVVKVLDFGIAKFLGVPRAAHLQTQAGFVVGTPAYMSPEQVLGKPVDHRSDLWQMAVIAFECVTGRRPFDGDTLGQLFMMICSAPMPVPSAALMPGASHVPAPMAAFDLWFARAAHRDPAFRFSSAGELAEALGAIFAPGGVGEAAIPTIAGVHGRSPAVPAGTGQNEAWSTGRAEPPHAARRVVPVALLAGLLLAPVTILVASGLWWGVTHRGAPAEVVPLATAAATSAGPTVRAPASAPPAAAEASATAEASAVPVASSAPPGASGAPGKQVPPAPLGGRHPGKPRGPKPPIDLGL